MSAVRRKLPKALVQDYAKNIMCTVMSEIGMPEPIA